MKRDSLVYIEDIMEALEKVASFLDGVSREEFLRDDLRQSAVVRQIEIIGEASKNVDEEFRGKYSEVEWRKMAGTRDILTHAYFGVSMEKVWEIFEKDLPALRKKILKILEEEK